MCQMTIFFIRVSIRRYTLYEKSTYASQKILLLAKYWVTKSLFSQAVSQKPKTKVFSSCLLLPWIDAILGHLHPQEALAHRIKQHVQYKRGRGA